MTPVKIVSRAAELGLDIIAIADHNSAEHVEVARKIASPFGLTVIPAMEICSSEEVHILALFEHPAPCKEVQEVIYSRIPAIPSYKHDETSQPVVNELDEILFFNPYPLINAVEMPLATLVDLIHGKNGLVIASHIDRESFSIISQLGFIPDDLALDALEVSYRVQSYREAADRLPLHPYQAVSFSDSHQVTDIGRRITEFSMERPSLEEIRLSLRGEGGRGFRILFGHSQP